MYEKGKPGKNGGVWHCLARAISKSKTAEVIGAYPSVDHRFRQGLFASVLDERRRNAIRRRAVRSRARSAFLFRLSVCRPENILITSIFLLPFLNLLPHPHTLYLLQT